MKTLRLSQLLARGPAAGRALRSAKRVVGLLLLGTAAPLAARAAVEIYQIDPAHSSVVFNVRHFFARVPGVFARFSGTLTVDRENFEHNAITATVDIGSLDTRQPDRNRHLLSADFFLAEKFPAATFTSKAWKKSGHDTYTVRGDLTIKDRTREIVLEVKPLGFGPGNRGAMLSGWEASFSIDRTDFDVGKSEKAIGDEVEMVVNIEAKLQPPAPPGPVTAADIQSLIEDATFDYTMGDSEGALAKLHRAAAAAPAAFEAWHALAEINFSLRRFDDALVAADQAHALRPDDLFINTTLSRIWMEKGDKATAEKYGAQAKILSWKDQLKNPDAAKDTL